jgi:hypothetical protein
LRCEESTLKKQQRLERIFFIDENILFPASEIKRRKFLPRPAVSASGCRRRTAVSSREPL